SIDVKTEIPLQQGQALKLAVSQTENGIRLTNVTGGANPADVAPDAVAPSPDALVKAPITPAPSAPPTAVLTPLEKATVTSAALAAGAVPSSGTVPDLKAALLVLRQTLQIMVGRQHAEPASLAKAEATPALAPTAAQELEPQEILLPQARVPVAEDIVEAIII